MIETENLGHIYRIQIRHDNSGISPDWLLDRVEIHDDIHSYVFVCEGWLSTSKGDKRIERTLYEKVSYCISLKRILSTCFFI